MPFMSSRPNLNLKKLSLRCIVKQDLLEYFCGMPKAGKQDRNCSSGVITDLKRELIAASFPLPVEDDRTAMPLMLETEIEESRAATLASVAVHENVWLFAYGSLMWKPEMEYTGRELATVRGYHRRFCLWQWRYRGTRDKPGLMMALDRGGACNGVLFQIPGPNASDRLAKVWYREMIGKAYRPVWINARTAKEKIRAVTFVADRNSPRYAGRISDAETAKYIASACGHIGPNATYLLETYLHCEESGIHDPMLNRLQLLVAAELAARSNLT